MSTYSVNYVVCTLLKLEAPENRLKKTGGVLGALYGVTDTICMQILSFLQKCSGLATYLLVKMHANSETSTFWPLVDLTWNDPYAIR